MAIVINTEQAELFLSSFDPVVVTATGSLKGGLVGIQSRAASHDIRIEGVIEAQNYGIAAGPLDLESGTPVVARVTIAETGSVEGRLAALALTGTLQSISNAGRLEGGDVAVIFDQRFGTTHAEIVNTGSILGERAAILIDQGTDFHGEVRVRNSGEIRGLESFSVQDRISTLDVVNSGTISGRIVSIGAVRLENTGMIEDDIETGDGKDVILNRGTILGDIQTGDGADVVSNTRAVDSGFMIMGGGDDVAYMGAFEELFDGGDGTDTASYRFGHSIALNLRDPELGKGFAKDDLFQDVEIFEGSDRGHDRMLGDDQAQVFRGLGGRDTLAGGGGADTLDGGAGVDKLAGGLGRDQFVFASAAEGGDVITDFTRGTGANADKIVIRFGDMASGGLSADQFQLRADTLAQDEDDRFIFRTGDTTLWFDADGSGAAAAVLLADLQPGAILSASDILIA